MNDNSNNNNKLRGSTSNVVASQIWNIRNPNDQIVIPFIIALFYSADESNYTINVLNDLNDLNDFSDRVEFINFVSITNEDDAIKFKKTGSRCWYSID